MIEISEKKISFDSLKKESFVLCKDDEFINKIESSQKFLYTEMKKRPIYGVNTGFGESGKNGIQQLENLQLNITRFHRVGVGELLSKEESRLVVLFRLISLSKGFSGVSFELLERLEFMLQNGGFPKIPSIGSVGASGDLTPLSYLASFVVGDSEEGLWFWQKYGLEEYKLKPKEGLAIMNGTSVMSAIAFNSSNKFEKLLNITEKFISGLFEVLGASKEPFAKKVHEVKPFSGQIESAQRMENYFSDSEKLETCRAESWKDGEKNIQDRYSLRCSPQILGTVWDTLKMVKNWIEIEVNSVNDNPIIDGEKMEIHSGCNFYGGYIAIGMDNLKIAIANLADLIDKELAVLIDYKFNNGLGENLKLLKEPHHHGFKAMQITASAISGEIIRNSAPVSTLSRPTESLNQDKVSMGTTSAMNFKTSLELYEDLISIGLLSLAQAVDIRGKSGFSKSLLDLHSKIREISEPLFADRPLDIDILNLKNELYLLQ
jgi:histidine ammonia-lyase